MYNYFGGSKLCVVDGKWVKADSISKDCVDVIRCKKCRWMSVDNKANRLYCHGRIGITFETTADGYCNLVEKR